jgi:hypothetical protein
LYQKVLKWVVLVFLTRQQGEQALIQEPNAHLNGECVREQSAPVIK